MTEKKEKDNEATIEFLVNGMPVELLVEVQVMPWHTIAHTLRETLGLTGTKQDAILENAVPALSSGTASQSYHA